MPKKKKTTKSAKNVKNTSSATGSRNLPATPQLPAPPSPLPPAFPVLPPPPPDPEPVTPAPGPGHFPRLENESEQEHRGFLLWAMQQPGLRSYRLTARAVGVTDTSVRRWAERRGWAERVSGQTRSDGLAWRAWLMYYADSAGLKGIAMVQANMKIEGPLTPLAYLRQKLNQPSDPTAYPVNSTARTILEAAADTSRRLMGDALPGDDDDGEEELIDLRMSPNPLGGGTRARVAANPLEDKGGRGEGGNDPALPHSSENDAKEKAADPMGKQKRVKRFGDLVNATLSIYAQDVKHTLDPDNHKRGNTVKVTPKEIPVLIELAEMLHNLPGDGGTAAQGPMESLRVRIAREKGEDLLDALQADINEQNGILEGLRQKKLQEAAHLRQELSMKKAMPAPLPDEG